MSDRNLEIFRLYQEGVLPSQLCPGENIYYVYQIYNLVNHKRYVGYTSALKTRWSKHKSDLKKNKHVNTHLQHSWNKHGEENFHFFVHSIHTSGQEAIKEEIRIIAFFKESQLSYNITPGGEGTIGISPSLETRKKIGDANRGRRHTEEALRRMSTSQKGRKHTSSHIANRLKAITPEKREEMTFKISKRYSFISPEGTHTEIVNLRRFCLERGLTSQSMYNVYLGKNKQHKGWIKDNGVREKPQDISTVQ